MIKKLMLLMALLGHFGHAFAAMSPLMDMDTPIDQEKPCLEHIESTSMDHAMASDSTPCEKRCVSTTLLFLSPDSIVERKLPFKIDGELNIQFTSLDTSINLPPPK